jgi:RND family efflux transporter MFP subunit
MGRYDYLIWHRYRSHLFRSGIGVVIKWLLVAISADVTARSEQGRMRVAGAYVVRTNLVRTTRETGEVRPHREVHIHPRVAGFVQTVQVELGDQVSVGQVLATMEVPELESHLARSRAAERRTQEEVTRAKAQLEEAQLARQRISAVASQGTNLVPAQELDASRVRVMVAEANLAAAREQVNVVRAELAGWETIRGYTRITAPFDGLVTQLGAVEGQWVTVGGSGGGLFRISEVKRLRLVFPISSGNVPRIQQGTPVEVRVDGRGEPITAQVNRRAGQIETATRTMDVEVDLENPDGRISPGAYATADVVIEARTNCLAIPLQGLVRGSDPKVWRIAQDGRLEERPVRLGMEVATHVEVLAGLAEGDRIVVGRQAGLTSGLEVEMASGGGRP